MKNKLALRRKEMLWLTVPVMALMLLATLFRDRGPSRIVIQDAKIYLVLESKQPRVDAGERMIETKLYVGYTGNRPSWWGDEIQGNFNADFFEGPNGKRFSPTAFGPLQFDRSRNSYLCRITNVIPNNPNFLTAATCNLRVKLKTKTGAIQRTLGIVETSIPAKDIEIDERY